MHYYEKQIICNFSKEEILTLYFNRMYFGHGRYGVGEAAQFYFSKSVQDLSLAEACLLIAIVDNPNRFSPYLNKKQSMKRHQLVFKLLVKNGLISESDSLHKYNEFWRNLKKIAIPHTNGFQNWNPTPG